MCEANRITKRRGQGLIVWVFECLSCSAVILLHHARSEQDNQAEGRACAFWDCLSHVRRDHPQEFLRTVIAQPRRNERRGPKHSSPCPERPRSANGARSGLPPKPCDFPGIAARWGHRALPVRAAGEVSHFAKCDTWYCGRDKSVPSVVKFHEPRTTNSRFPIPHSRLQTSNHGRSPKSRFRQFPIPFLILRCPIVWYNSRAKLV